MHSLPQLIIHVLLVKLKMYLVQHVDKEPILILCVVLPLVCLVVHQPTLLDGKVVYAELSLGVLNTAK